jgi:hypothetical protein
LAVAPRFRLFPANPGFSPSSWEGKRLLAISNGATSMKPNILKFWFWRARLMMAGQHDINRDKTAKVQVNDELTIELHPVNGLDKRPFVKLCRTTETEQQAVTIYLKEIPFLVDLLPKIVAQLMALGGEQHSQRGLIRQMEFTKGRPEWVE